MIKHIHDKIEFLKEIADNDKVLVDFFATWCGPCQMLTPVVEKVSKDHPELLVIKVDVDQAPELAAMYTIFSVPTLQYFENGKLVRQEAGYRPEASLLKFVNL